MNLNFSNSVELIVFLNIFIYRQYVWLCFYKYIRAFNYRKKSISYILLVRKYLNLNKYCEMLLIPYPSHVPKYT